MYQNGSENDNSSDYEPVSTIEVFSSLFNDSNFDKHVNQINQSIDTNDIRLKEEFYNDEDSKKSFDCNCKLFFYRISDIMMFFVIFLSIIFDLFSMIANVIDFSVSFYSVIIMNYVFFISSIVSYTMAPIYKILSGDWLNFALSFAQVILSTPLIAFYIYYIIKSVVTLGEFLQSTFEVVKHIFSIVTIDYKNYFNSFLSTVFKKNYILIFDLEHVKKLMKLLLFSILKLVIFCLMGYLLFCIDRCIIILGIIYYALNTLQIFILIIPSYLYFIKTLLNKKCYKSKCVDNMIDIIKKYSNYDEESNSSAESDLSNFSDDQPFSVPFNNLFFFRKSKFNSLMPSENKVESVESMKINTESNVSNQNDCFEIESIQNESNNIESIKDETLEDESISGMKNNDKKEYKKKYIQLTQMFIDLVIANEYIPLYDYSMTIAFDRHKLYRKRICMLIFLLLNITVIAYDIYQLTKEYSDYLLVSIIARFILIPLFSYYNFFTVLYHKARNITLRIVIYVSIIITGLIVIAIIIGFAFVGIYQSKFRINDLNYIPPFDNITIANEKMIIHPICNHEIFGVSAFDAFGYALGGYDIKRNKTIFENQMKIFFGENYSSHINYTIYELDKYFLFLKYYDFSINTHIYAFRGYNSGPEIAFQFELFASYYILPFFEDNVPFLESINEYWLGFYIDFLNSFGLRFFENSNLIVKYVKSIIDIYNDSGLENETNVLFTGINCGGVIAKIVGTSVYRKSISFISFPMNMDFLENWFHFSSSYISYVTNVFNVDGFFSHPDSDYANNIGIDTPVYYKSKFCTSEFCELFSKTDNIYRTFCTMSETCGKGNQFHYYCQNTIGDKNIEIIRESLQDDDD